jgi:cytidylate kinase
MKRALIAVDGPAGAGKSTVSRRLARELGFRYVDTGAMYRVVGVLAAERGLDLGDANLLGALCDQLDIVFEERADGLHTLAGGRDLSREIRTAEAGQLASKVSAIPAVRERLVARQRDIGRDGGVVMEGRDIGTVVFPDATLKIFLVASPEARAQRRSADLGTADVGDVLREMTERDRRDQERAHSPLRPADDAIVIDTTDIGVADVVGRVREILAGRRSA